MHSPWPIIRVWIRSPWPIIKSLNTFSLARNPEFEYVLLGP
jgi:hypothetical protein